MTSLSDNFSTPLQSIFWPTSNSILKRTLLILAGVIFLFISSQLSVPLQPVPLTFQSAAVIFIGMAYGARYSASVILSYFFLGTCGLPVFANFAGGINHFFGPTAGYLIGFLPAAYVGGYLAQIGWAKTPLRSFIAGCISVLLIFIPGILVLAKFVGLHNAIIYGVAPYLISEPVKLILISLLVPKLWKKAQ